MRLDLTDDQQLFHDTIHRFVATETPIDKVRARIDAPEVFDADWWRRAAELGFSSLLVPESAGGGSISGSGPVDLVIVAEELGRGVVPSPLLPVNVVAETLGRHADGAHRNVLDALLAGTSVATWVPGQGSIELVDDDAGGYVLDGAAAEVEAADQADQLLVTAGSPAAPTQLLVPASAQGVTITPQHGLDLLRHWGRVRFDGVRVGREAVVGSPGAAAPDVARQRSIALLIQSAEMCGAAARVLEFTLEYAFDRYSFGRPLASYQALKHRFADMKLWIEAAHAVTDAAAVALSAGDDPAGRVLAAKAYVGDKSVDIIQDCVQMHGGIGVTWEHDIHLYLRRATANRELFGAPSEHRQALAVLLGA